jgi:uncharacterized protein
MHVVEVRGAELVETLAAWTNESGITDAAIVSLIGAADSFTISTMPHLSALQDVITDYDHPAEMTGTGEIVGGTVHIHAVMAVEGDRGIAGHLHRAQISTHFARAYIMGV